MLKLPYASYWGSPTKKYNVSFGGLDLRDAAPEGSLVHTLNTDSSRIPYISSRRVKYSGDTLYDADTGEGVFSVWGDGETFALFKAKPGGVGSTVSFRTYGSETSAIPELDAVWTWGDEKHDTVVRCGNYLIVFADPTSSNLNKNTAPMYYNEGADPQYGWTSLSCAVSGTGVFAENTLTLTGYTVMGGLCGLPDFREGDAITVKGCKNASENNLTYTLSGITSDEGSITFTFYGADFGDAVEANVEASRSVPEGLKYPIVVNNRIWGVCDGQICASALGDPTNWERFEGIASDSYRVGVATSLDFTASGVFGSNPVFFKENSVYRVYGTLPSSFTLHRLDVPGVMEGCHRSVCKINETLYYKGRNGFYRYSGGVPVCISQSLGDLSEYCDAVAGEDGRRYFVSMRRGEIWTTFVYDTLMGIWHREADLCIYAFGKFGGVTYFLGSDLKLYCYDLDETRGLAKEKEGKFPWSMTFAPFNETVRERKVYSDLYLRMELEEGAYASVYVSRDGGRWSHVYTAKGREGVSTVTVPVRPRKCDSFNIKIEGEGQMCLKTLVRQYRTAGAR